MNTKEYMDKLAIELNKMPLDEFEMLVHKSMQGSSNELVEIHNKVMNDKK